MVRDKAERLVNLTTALLEARAPRTFAQLRDQLRNTYDQDDPESARRMFERDKNELRGLGIPITTTRLLLAEADGYLIDRSDYELAPLDLSVEEASALLAGVAMTGGEDERLAVTRLTTHFTEPIDVDPAPAMAVSLADEHLATVAEAVSSRTTITFTYRRADGRERTRTVDPWAIGIRNGIGYVTGWDHDRGAQRVFRLSRIVSRIRLVGEPEGFERPEDVDLGAELTAPLGEGVDVTVVVEPTAIAAVRTRGGRMAGAADAAAGVQEGQEQADDGDDWVRMVFPHSDPVRLMGWLTGMADRVVVVDPLDLHDRVRAQLAEVVAAADAGDEA